MPVPAPSSKTAAHAILSLLMIACFMAPFMLSMSGAYAETYVFDGTTTSTMHAVETATVHVTGMSLSGLANGSKLICNTSIPASSSVDGFSQSVQNVNIAVSTSPSGIPYTYSDLIDSYGNPYRQYLFKLDGLNVSTLDIRTTASFDATVTGDASKVNYTDSMSEVSSVGPSVYPQFIAPTLMIQSNDTAIINEKNALLSGVSSEAEAIDRIMDFVRTRIPDQAASTPDKVDAVSSLYASAGTCDNRVNLALAILRSAGIPSRYVSGIVYDSIITYHINNSGIIQTSWGNSPHSWVEVYYPKEHAWVPYDPYIDKGFLDTRHIQSGISVDGDIQDRATHGDFDLVHVDANQGTTVSVTSDISVSGLIDNPHLSYLYTGQSPAGQIMYARDLQYSSSQVPSVTPTPTPVLSNQTANVTVSPGGTQATPAVSPGQAQAVSGHNFSGVVLDAATGAPVGNATVGLGIIQVTASSSGQFTFMDALSSGTYDLSVQAPGYTPYHRIITANGADMDLSIQLSALSGPSPAAAKRSPSVDVVVACMALIGGAMLSWRTRAR